MGLQLYIPEVLVGIVVQPGHGLKATVSLSVENPLQKSPPDFEVGVTELDCHFQC